MPILKIKVIAAIFLGCLFFSSAFVFGAGDSWKEVQPFYSCEIKSMVVHPSGKIFAGTLYDGIYVSNGQGGKLETVLFY